MLSMTLAQMAEKPSTVATEETISSFADSRQRRSPSIFLRPNRMPLLPIPLHVLETLKSA
jgi:hypothetical protein